MARLRIYNITQSCDLVDPRGGVVIAVKKARPEYVYSVKRDVLEWIESQLVKYSDLGIFDYELGDDPDMCNYAESASIEDVLLLATPAQNTVFKGTIGTDEDAQWETLGEAILAFETSPATSAIFTPSASATVEFGPLDVVSTKPVRIGGYYQGTQITILFEPGSGVWTYNASSLHISGCLFGSDKDNLTGYLTTDMSELIVILERSALFSWSSLPVIRVLSSKLYLHAISGSRLQKTNVPIEGLVGYAVIETNDIDLRLQSARLDQDAVVSSTLPWSNISFSDDSVLPTNMAQASSHEARSLLRYSKPHVATANPTSTDDVDKFFQRGCWWYNRITDRMFYCSDNRSLIAKWPPLNKSFSGSGSPDGVVSGYFGDSYYDTDSEIWYRCISDPSGTDWGLA